MVFTNGFRINSSVLISMMLRKDLNSAGGLLSSFWDESCVLFIIAADGCAQQHKGVSR